MTRGSARKSSPTSIRQRPNIGRFSRSSAPKIEAGTHPIDALIERKHREQKFVATEPADLRTLIRRTTFDLLGLPPTEKQLRDFAGRLSRNS